MGQVNALKAEQDRAMRAFMAGVELRCVPVLAQMWGGEGLVLAQMWAGESPVLAQMWAGVSAVPASSCGASRCPIGAPRGRRHAWVLKSGFQSALRAAAGIGRYAHGTVEARGSA